MKKLYILTTRDVRYNMSGKNPKVHKIELFICADNDEDAILSWMTERDKIIEDRIKEAYGWEKTDYRTWCIYAQEEALDYWDDYLQYPNYIRCNFTANSDKYKDEKTCPKCKHESLEHMDVIANRAQLRKWLEDEIVVTNIREWKPRKSQTIGVYKYG